MFYHIQINYFCSQKQKQVLLTEANITDIDDMRKRIVDPYTFGHSFNFQGIDILLASIHSFNIYESETAINIVDVDAALDSIQTDIVEVTQEFVKR